jgi:hypothetical protein
MSIDRCTCGRRFDRPGHPYCSAGGSHEVQPDKAWAIVEVIDRVNDRRGMGLDTLEDELADEIRERWVGLIREILARPDRP